MPLKRIERGTHYMILGINENRESYMYEHGNISGYSVKFFKVWGKIEGQYVYYI